MNKFFYFIFICLLSISGYGQEINDNNRFFIRFSNFKPDLGFSSDAALDIPGKLNIIDVDPTNHPGHSYELGVKKRITNKTFLNATLGVLQARQAKSFLNYRFDEDYQEFGYTSFYITSAAYQHHRMFLNMALEKYLFHGFFIEPGIKVSADVSSIKDNRNTYIFSTQEMIETYASTFFDIPRQSTPIVLFYNVRMGYNYKGFIASFLYEQNFTKIERKFMLRGVEYIEKQAFWKNVGFSLAYEFNIDILKKSK